MAGDLFTVPGGGHHHQVHGPILGSGHGMGSLSHGEFQAAQNALAKISSVAGTLGGSLARLSQNAAGIGGSLRADALHAPGLLHGSGNDTFVGGARSSLLAGIGSDTVLGGSVKSLDGGLGAFHAQNIRNFALSADTINPAGLTALTVKALDNEAGTKAHTVTVGDKTTITINGLSAHDISKLSH